MSHSTIVANRFFTTVAIATQFNSKLMTSTLEPHPRSHLHVILLSYWLMKCPPSPSLIIQQYLSRMHFICVSDSLFPKTTTWCNWKNIQFYFPLTQLPFLEQTNPILHLEHMLGGNNDIYERGARIGYWYCCRDETNTICSGGGLILIAFSICTVRSIAIASNKLWKTCNNQIVLKWSSKHMQWFWSWNIICRLGYMANWVGTCQWNPFHLYVIQWWLEQWVCGQSIDS